MQKSIIGKELGETESNELKKIYNHYLDERIDDMKITQPRVDDLFVDIISKNSFSPEQTTKIINFRAKLKRVVFLY